MTYFVHIEIEADVVHEVREFIKLKDAERFAFHQRRIIRDFFTITITSGNDLQRQLSILIGPKHRELYGT